eukprot:SAG11_NODE_11635_length_745_cov_1.300926_1_plen_27_part_10
MESRGKWGGGLGHHIRILNKIDFLTLD